MEIEIKDLTSLNTDSIQDLSEQDTKKIVGGDSSSFSSELNTNGFIQSSSGGSSTNAFRNREAALEDFFSRRSRFF